MSLNLSEAQNAVILRACAGESVFITGAAGTGKSAVLLETIRRMRALHGAKHVTVCAPTGAAAAKLPGGTTLHRFLGLGVGDEKSTNEANHRGRRNWSQCKCLIIDEISQLSDRFLDRIASLAAMSVPANCQYEATQRGGRSLFGIQVIVSGDFFQLPPVNGDYCFQSKIWKYLFPPTQCFELTEVFRQRDEQFVRALNQVRLGGSSVTKETYGYLFQDCSSVHHCVGSKLSSEHVSLYPTRAQAAQTNRAILDAMEGEAVCYHETDDSVDEVKVNKPPLCLKVGAMVFIDTNISLSDGLVNGTLGTIVGFEKIQDESQSVMEYFPVVQYEHLGRLEERVITRIWKSNDVNSFAPESRRIPITLAHALTIHKAQGMEIKSKQVVVHLTRSKGSCSRNVKVSSSLAYVALSRSTSRESLHVCTRLAPVAMGSILPAPKQVVEFYRRGFRTDNSCSSMGDSTSCSSIDITNQVFTSDGFIRSRRNRKQSDHIRKTDDMDQLIGAQVRVGKKENNKLNVRKRLVGEIYHRRPQGLRDLQENTSVVAADETCNSDMCKKSNVPVKKRTGAAISSAVDASLRVHNGIGSTDPEEQCNAQTTASTAMLLSAYDHVRQIEPAVDLDRKTIDMNIDDAAAANATHSLSAIETPVAFNTFGQQQHAKSVVDLSVSPEIEQDTYAMFPNNTVSTNLVLNDVSCGKQGQGLKKRYQNNSNQSRTMRNSTNQSRTMHNSTNQSRTIHNSTNQSRTTHNSTNQNRTTHNSKNQSRTIQTNQSSPRIRRFPRIIPATPSP